MSEQNNSGSGFRSSTTNLVYDSASSTMNSEDPPSMFIPDDVIEDSLNEWKFSLIGRLYFVKLKMNTATTLLKQQWSLKGSLQFIPLGKGFFIIKLDNEDDKKHIWQGLWMVEEQTLKIRPWEPNFNPETQKTSLAYVWVTFLGLSIEYWKESILLQMGNKLGRAIKVDEITLKREIGYYASVLVDFAKYIPSKVVVEYKYGKFKQAVQILKKPKFCNHCLIVGHLTVECRIRRSECSEKQTEVVKEKAKKQWRKKTSQVQTGFDICFTQVEKEKEHIIEQIHDQLLSDNEEIDAIIPPIQTNVVNIQPPIGTPVLQLQSISQNIKSKKAEDCVQVKHTDSESIQHAASTSGTKNGKEFIQIKTKVGKKPNVITRTQVSSDFIKKLRLQGIHYQIIHNSCDGNKGNIWILWSSSINTPKILSSTSQAITVEVGGAVITGVHAATITVNRRELWHEMEIANTLNKPWLVIGDFNTITSVDEKKGGLNPLKISMREFNDCLNNCGFIQAPKTGLEFSWCNKGGKKRILCNFDRAVFNDKWLEVYPRWGYKVGVRSISDHGIIYGANVEIPKPKNIPFRALKVWQYHS
ncbi:uncharacterized protein LOC113295530 [Papaver somniferum]|uniref:uncharacterized protein LOC113295530 n=1 Tax=Papaver somniferum TaxID=3469 RepID=UPI000E705B71|nr:uncharacterized protein LOC113295530 [Papaver somniferum]